MSAPVALLVFLVGLGVSLLASEFLVRGLGRLGAKVGLAAGLLGLLTALGADGPEISSAITALLSGAKDVGVGVILGSNLFNLAALFGLSAVIAGRVGFHRVLLAVDGGVALWVTIVVGVMLLSALAPVIALLLILVVFISYVALLAVRPHTVATVPIAARFRHRLEAATRLVHSDLQHGEPPQIDRESSWTPVWMVLPSAAGIIAGSYAMVNGALVLGDAWHIPREFLGAVALAALTSLPNAYAAARLALMRNGVAVLSLTFNSNTLNLLAGISIPALFLGGLKGTSGAAVDIAWLLALTVFAIALGWWQSGMTRLTGVLLIAGYLCFIGFAIR